MKNNKLQIRDVYERTQMEAEMATALNSFMEATVMDLLDSDSYDWRSQFTTTEQDFYDAGKSVLDDMDVGFSLTIGTSLIMQYVPCCEFKFGKHEQISGILNSWFDIKGLYYVTADGSEIDLSWSLEIRNYLGEQLNIES